MSAVLMKTVYAVMAVNCGYKHHAHLCTVHYSASSASRDSILLCSLCLGCQKTAWHLPKYCAM